MVFDYQSWISCGNQWETQSVQLFHCLLRVPLNLLFPDVCVVRAIQGGIPSRSVVHTSREVLKQIICDFLLNFDWS